MSRHDAFASIDLHDRVVTDISAAGGTSAAFSSFLDASCLVLLGDAGAGKTSLFTHFAAQEDAHYTDSASFLDFWEEADIQGKIVYLDALDEQREGKGLHETLVKVVQKLRQLKPAKVRIACRAADWWAGVRSSVQADGFLGSGRLLRMEPLSQAQSFLILEAAGVGSPAEFVQTARARGLHELLGNPQNLLMLTKAVGRGAHWPGGRHALYAGAVEELLAEQNPLHRRVPRSFGPEALRSVAGGLCALRLLSDMGGIALRPSDRERFPYYGDIALANDDAMLGALGRRVFAVAGDDVMDSSHRTVAEFLAGQWLAAQVEQGLPLGRIRALLGVDDTPATSLRGLHAWLAVMLDLNGPDEASELISADPGGVLIYADGSMLRLASKQRLLGALASKGTPASAEYTALLSELNLGTLSCADMVPAFRAALAPASRGTHLRTVVLDVIRLGQPRPELRTELLAILNDAADAGRYPALQALLRLPERPIAALTDCYSRLGSSQRELALKKSMLVALHGKTLGIDDVLGLLEEAQSPGNSLYLSKAPYLDLPVSDTDAAILLDGLHDYWQRCAGVPGRSAELSILGLIDVLLAQVLHSAESWPGGQLFAWLSLRHHYAHGGSFDLVSPATPQALSLRNDALEALADLALGWLAQGKRDLTVIRELQQLSFAQVTDAILIERAVGLLRTMTDGREMHALYVAARMLVDRMGEGAATHRAALSELARANPALAPLAETLHPPMAAPAKSELAPSALKTRWSQLEHFIVARQVDLRCAKDMAMLARIGELCYDPSYGRVSGPYGAERIAFGLGEDAAGIVSQHLFALAADAQILPLPEVLDLAASNHLPPLALAIAAGIELAQSPLPAAVLPSRLLIVSVLVRQCRAGRGMFAPAIKASLWQEEILRTHPEMAVGAYELLARACLRQDPSPVHGLNELCGNPLLAPYSLPSVRDLLHDHPNLDEAAARLALPFVLKGSSVDENRALIASMLHRSAASPLAAPGYLLWLAVAMVAEPGMHDGAVASVADPSGLIAALHLVVGMGALRPFVQQTLSAEAVGSMVDLVVAHTRPRDIAYLMSPANRLLDGLIELLEHDPDPVAGQHLRRLRAADALLDFHQRLDLAIPRQRILAVDNHYRPYAWRRILETLRNGPPANVRDFQELVMDHLKKIEVDIAGSNLNVHKWFWNEDKDGGTTTPKCENSARDVLMGMLAYRLGPHRIDVQPEGNMKDNQRADIVLSHAGMKLVVELKRDSHPKMRTAIKDQLDKYTKLPQTGGRGIYGVFWYGAALPSSPTELCNQLRTAMPHELAERIRVFVLDLSASAPKKANKPRKAKSPRQAGHANH